MIQLENQKSTIEEKGVTFIELMLICAILGVLIAIAVPSFDYFYMHSDLNNTTEEAIKTLRTAQNKTLASETDTQYGVHFETQKYTLFEGGSYDESSSSNKDYQIPEDIEIYDINLNGGGSEVIFNRLTGSTDQFGEVSLRSKEDTNQAKTIYINEAGRISSVAGVSITDAREKDSRHIHVDYSRSISTSSEKLILNFTYNSSTTTKEIIISDNMEDGQIYWEGQVDVDGSPQILKIHTHQLNNPDTIFCIHRDRRYNDKALTINISGDTSGSIVEYSADGASVTNSSIYASDVSIQ